MVVHGSNEFIVTFRQSKGARMGEDCITSQTFKLYVMGRITLLQHTNHVQYVVY